jgi:gamma-tubulin complex component 5
MASQESIVTSLAKTATTVEQLRRFVSVVFSRSILHTQTDAYRKIASTRTCEAFADAIDEAIRGLDAWCAAREEAMCRAYAGVDEEPLVVSLLGTEKALQDQYGTSFDILLEIVQQAFQIKPSEDVALFDNSATIPQKRLQPSALTALLLDTLFTSVQQHMERRDTVTSDALMRVFVRTAEPVWGMVGRWLKDGMGLGLGIGSGGESGIPGRAEELDDEFFIESSGVGVGMMGMGLLDPEFWKEGYSLREGVISSRGSPLAALAPTRKAIPSFLEHIAELVLGTGKAVGLMRALGEAPLSNAFNDWKSLSEVVRSETHGVNEKTEEHTGLFSVSVDTLSRLIYDSLLPHCQATGARLAKVLVDECGLWKHLNAIEDLFLMRKGDTMSHFIDVLFTKVRYTCHGLPNSLN